MLRHRFRGRVRTVAAAAVVAIAAAGVSIAPANATSQGENGFIAFQTPVDNRFHIALARPDGSGYHVLDMIAPGMAAPPILAHPAVSPDGTRIAFAESGGSNSVWTAHLDGTHLVRLTTPPPQSFDDEPAWSRDGTKVYFTHATSSPTTSQIFSTFADGSGGAAPLSSSPSGFLDSKAPPRRAAEPTTATLPY